MNETAVEFNQLRRACYNVLVREGYRYNPLTESRDGHRRTFLMDYNGDLLWVMITGHAQLVCRKDVDDIGDFLVQFHQIARNPALPV